MNDFKIQGYEKHNFLPATCTVLYLQHTFWHVVHGFEWETYMYQWLRGEQLPGMSDSCITSSARIWGSLV